MLLSEAKEILKKNGYELSERLNARQAKKRTSTYALDRAARPHFRATKEQMMKEFEYVLNQPHHFEYGILNAIDMVTDDTVNDHGVTRYISVTVAEEVDGEIVIVPEYEGMITAEEIEADL